MPKTAGLEGIPSAGAPRRPSPCCIQDIGQAARWLFDRAHPKAGPRRLRAVALFAILPTGIRAPATTDTNLGGWPHAEHQACIDRDLVRRGAPGGAHTGDLFNTRWREMTVNYANACRDDECASTARHARGLFRFGSVCVLGACAALTGLAQAQSGSTPPKAPDSSLTWNGITLYGIVDLVLRYQTHGVPISDYFSAGTEST